MSDDSSNSGDDGLVACASYASFRALHISQMPSRGPGLSFLGQIYTTTPLTTLDDIGIIHDESDTLSKTSDSSSDSSKEQEVYKSSSSGSDSDDDDDDDDLSSAVSNVSFAGPKTLQDLQKDRDRKKQEIDFTIEKMKYAEEVDVCFLVDSTGSMWNWIDTVKKNIKLWSARLYHNYKHLNLRIAFICYTDHDQPEDIRTKSLDFTSDPERVVRFADSINVESGVGGDTCEDVFGGLKAVTKLQWRCVGTKVLIHIADAPCHGKEFHRSCYYDKYPDGDPGKLNLDILMEKLVRREIIYHFGYIDNDATSLMIDKFNKSLMTQASMTSMIRVFDASKLSAIDKVVYKLITESIRSTVQRQTDQKKRKEPLKIKYKSVRNTDAQVIIDWDQVESQEMMTTPPQPESDSVKIVQPPSVPQTIKKEKLPFAQGATRYAYHGLIDETKEHIVLKEFIRREERNVCLKRFLEIAEISTSVTKLVLNFNTEKLPSGTLKLEVIPVGIVDRPTRRKHKQCYFTYEKYIPGKYEKYNDNYGGVCDIEGPANHVCQAFSHYTWVKSEGRLLVCDMQGVQQGSTLLLSDLAIHDKNVLLYGATNLGVKGIRRFFEKHQCNKICQSLRLKKYSAQAFQIDDAAKFIMSVEAQ